MAILGAACVGAAAASALAGSSPAGWAFAAVAFVVPASMPAMFGDDHEAGLAVAAALAVTVAAVALMLAGQGATSAAAAMARRSGAVHAVRCASLGAVVAVAWTLVARRAERIASRVQR